MPETPYFEQNEKYKNEYIAIYMNGSEGGHRMTIVGYDDNIWTDVNCNDKVDDGEIGAFKVANSWGKDWDKGNDGFIWVAYDALNLTSSVENFSCDGTRMAIFSEFCRITVKEPAKNSDICLVYTLNSADRNQTKITIEATDGKNTYKGTISPYNTLTNFGELSYNGSINAEDGTMVYDLRNVVPGLTSENFNDYFWDFTAEDTTSDQKPLIVKELKIVDHNIGKTYELPSYYFPMNVDGYDFTFSYAQKGKALVYYSGYYNPSISYTLDGETTANVKEMTPYTDYPSYTHRTLIDLGDSPKAYAKFTDGNGNWDDCYGNNFTIFPGKNYCYSNNVKVPELEINVSGVVENEKININNLRSSKSYDITVTGGHAPYTYEATCENIENPAAEHGTAEVNNNKLGINLKSVGKHKVTVTVTDAVMQVHKAILILAETHQTQVLLHLQSSTTAHLAISTLNQKAGIN